MDDHGDPPPKRRRRLRPIENLDWSLFEGMEAILGKGEQALADAPKENGHDVSEAAEESKLQENGHASAAEKPKLQEVVTTNTNHVIAAVPSAAKSRPRAKRKAKQAGDVDDVAKENGHDVAETPETQAATVDAASLPEEVVTTNTNGHVIAAIPSAAKSRARAKRKAKQEESAVADVPSVDFPVNGHDVSAEKQPKTGEAEAPVNATLEVVTTNTNKVIAAIPSAAKSRPRAKRKAKQEDAAEPFPAPAANGVMNAAPGHLKEPIQLETSEAENVAAACSLQETKAVETETAAKARPRAKRKAKQAESKMVAEASENPPKEVDEKSAEKPSEAESSKEGTKSEAPKRPRAKRKAKADLAVAVEPCWLKPDSVTNGEQHSEEPAASTSSVTDAKAVANMVPENEADAGDLRNDLTNGVELEASTLLGTAEAPQDLNRDTDEPAAEAKADEGPASSSGPPLEGEAEEAEEPDTATADAAKDPTPFTVPPRRRRRVKLRRRRQAAVGADLFVRDAALFQPFGDPDSPQACEAPPGPDPLKEAEEVLSELLQQQALMCKEVRISIEDRLQEVFEEWRCLHDRINTSAEYCVRQVLDAVSQGQHADATTLGLAIEEAQQLGLPERQAITDRLEELKKLEEVEGVWQCLSTCLRDADRLGVVFWSKEAEDLGLEVPEVLTPALDAMRDEEAARLKRMELEASFNAQAAEAHARKDVSALRAMAQHAKASGQDPSAALAALEDLGEAEEVEEEELERLFVSSPNGQNHCFGMYVLVREERGNGMPVWRQLGGERWIYTDELGRWTVGSSKVRQNGFRGSAGFIFCPQKNHGVLPDKMQFWARFDEEAKKWKKDEDITIASEYQEEVIESKFSKRAKGRAAKKSAKGKGKGGKGKEEKPKARAKAKAAARPEAKAHARPAFAQPAHQSGLTQPQAMRILELPSDRLLDLREEVINKAYRRLALRWHPDRHCNRHKKEEANAKFVELRNAFELMRDFLKAKKPIQDGAH